MISADILIIGSGPAGLQAAIHASRSKLRTILIGKTKYSGLSWAHIENYCCMDGTHLGSDFLDNGIKQARSFGTEIIEDEILKIERIYQRYKVHTDTGSEILAKALILASGVRRNRLGAKGEDEYRGKGLSYCVDCDANFFKGKIVAVVGEGAAAASGALLLRAYARRVYLISEKLDIGERLRSQIEAAEITIIGSQVKEIQGDDKVRSLLFGDDSSIDVDGVFIELGQKGAVELVSGIGVLLNSDGYIMTNKAQECSVAGLFAAGDVCGPPFQVAKAVGEGCIAGLNSSKYARDAK